MDSSPVDGPFEVALQECGNIDKFLDTFFSFLARRTDFFVKCPSEGGRLGFPEGHAEAMVRSHFKRWEAFAAESPTSCANAKDAGGEKAKKMVQKQKVKGPEPEDKKDQEDRRGCLSSDDSYNGRVTDKYSWSQIITEVDVKIPVGKEILKGKQVKVSIGTQSLSVGVVGADKPILDGKLCFPVKKEDCYWNLLPGDCIRVFLQKSQERWWQALLEGEELLDMSGIEAVRPMEELDQEEQMKIQELCWNEERKRQGLPTTEDTKMHKMLEKAWNAEGSPFKGTPVDPSIVQIAPQNTGTFVPPKD